MVFNTDRGIAKEYEEFKEHREFDKEFNTDRGVAKRHIAFQFKGDREDEEYKLQEVLRPVLQGGCNLEEFKSFTQQWRLYTRCNEWMDDRELRQQH